MYLAGALTSVLDQKLVLARNYVVFNLIVTAWVKVGGDVVEATLLAHYGNNGSGNNGAAMESPKNQRLQKREMMMAVLLLFGIHTFENH